MQAVQSAHANRLIRLLMLLRQRGITDTNVLSAIEKTPREIFVPEQMQDKAYEDTALPIGCGQTISQPYVVARMTQELALDDRMKVLEIGTGSGYQAVILSHLCRRLYTIERQTGLHYGAQQVFDNLRRRNITALLGDGMKGWTAQAPFDRIIVTAGAMKAPPEALKEQLKVGGIMVIPVGDDPINQTLRRYKKEDEDLFAIQDLCPVRFVPLLPDVA